MRWWLVGLGLVLVAPEARADAIMPLLDPCPAPKVKGIRGHAEVCLDPPPTNCPSGYRGVTGGQCELAHCGGGQGCDAGRTCSEVSLCFEKKRRNYCGAPFSPELLAGPPRECGEAESVYEEATGVCGQGAACAGECRPGKLCLVPGQKAAPPAPTAPPTSGGPGGASAPPTAPPKGGCAGCSAGGSSPAEAALALLMAAAGLGALASGRGRRR